MLITRSGNSEQRNRENMQEGEREELNDWLLQGSLPALWSIACGSHQKQVSFNGSEDAQVRAEAFSFDGFLVSQVSISTEDRTLCECTGKGGTVGLYFNLEGSCLLRRQGDDYPITAGEHTIYYTSDYSETVEVTPHKGAAHVFEINVPVPFYKRLLSGHSQLQDDFLGRIENGISHQLQPGMLPITMPMKWIINSIRQNQRTGVLKRLFLEARILELLMLQIEQAELREREFGPRTTQPSEQEALLQARAILEKSIVQPPTIRHLARMVGINEFTLKKGFRETFQETIYGFVSKLRMQQARGMLLEGNKSIHEVAQLAGYKNPQHFTAAFKKYYGVLPSKVK